MNPFASALLHWFDRAGRKHLPWQGRDAYRVWISEIMLQQTQVTTVIPYYERFMQRFPDVGALANAPLDEVLHLWTGLGYYARARHLHRAAQQLMQQHQGIMPRTLDAVQSLPGIGRSTAAAILAQAYELPHAILDGNVKRVLTRYFGIHGFPGNSSVESQLWEHAQHCTPATRVADYTQAIMDLGALVCTCKNPLCHTCPLAGTCIANAHGLQSQLPTPRPKRKRPQRVAHVAVISNHSNAVLLQQRPAAGLWGGLWVCPQFDDEASCKAFVQSIVMSNASIRNLPVIHHAFTHFDLQLHPWWAADATPREVVADTAGYCWYDPLHPARIGLAKPVLDILKCLNRAQAPLENAV
ncbi:MAG TPA: A/G-specific adenine glycosylase [Steroidobacteraceae bacterium]|nr:A/G-specific adenine glycosylase [Steroidobacteraceae bacterium]